MEGSGIAIGLGLSGVCDLPKRCASSGGLLLLIGESLLRWPHREREDMEGKMIFWLIYGQGCDGAIRRPWTESKSNVQPGSQVIDGCTRIEKREWIGCVDVVVLSCRKELPGIHDSEVEGAILKLRKVKLRNAA